MASLKKELLVLIMSMLPVWELRGTIPFAVEVLHLSLPTAIVLSVIGNSIPVVLILLYLEKFIKFFTKYFPGTEKFFSKLFERTRKKHSKRVELLAELALFAFVAIPLPGTGGWTGALIAVVFNLNRRRSFWSIFLGLIGASVIVSLTYTGSKALIMTW